MASSLWSPEVMRARSPPAAATTASRVTSGANAGGPITPKSTTSVATPWPSMSSFTYRKSSPFVSAAPTITTVFAIAASCGAGEGPAGVLGCAAYSLSAFVWGRGRRERGRRLEAHESAAAVALPVPSVPKPRILDDRSDRAGRNAGRPGTSPPAGGARGSGAGREQKGTWLRLVSQCHATRFSRNVCGHVQQRARVCPRPYDLSPTGCHELSRSKRDGRTSRTKRERMSRPIRRDDTQTLSRL